MKIRYIHLINGQTAQYHKGEQICYGGRTVEVSAISRSQILQQQKASCRWRKKHGFSSMAKEYSYRRLKIL